MIWGTTITILGLAAFLYFGYKDDYKRDKKGFIYSVTSTLLLISGFTLIFTKNSIIAWIFAIVFIILSVKFRSKILKNDKES